VFALKLPVTAATVSAIKAELTRTLSPVKSMHRCEAIARGLGYRTYASLLDDLDSASILIATIEGGAFRSYLNRHGFDVPPLPFYLATARVAIRVAMDQTPKLTAFGIGIGEPKRKADGAWESGRELQAKYDREREVLLTDNSVHAFLASLAFLSRVKRTTTVRPKANSYWIKHIAENFACTFPEGDKLGPRYIPNGVLIAAAIHAGFQIKTYVSRDSGRGSLNATFNMSTTSLTELDVEVRPDGARAQTRRVRAEQRARGIPRLSSGTLRRRRSRIVDSPS
jgi:hypothetical protein